MSVVTGDQMLQILSPEGELVGEAPVDLDGAAQLYETLVFARSYDRKGTALQKQGRLATYAPFEGQEAAQVGSAATLRPDDWMVPSYREPIAMWMHGYPLELLLATRTGSEQGGRRRPRSTCSRPRSPWAATWSTPSVSRGRSGSAARAASP